MNKNYKNQIKTFSEKAATKPQILSSPASAELKLKVSYTIKLRGIITIPFLYDMFLKRSHIKLTAKNLLSGNIKFNNEKKSYMNTFKTYCINSYNRIDV